MIGTGNMGKILIEAFIESLAVQPSNITITNRTLKKTEMIKFAYPEITVVPTAKDVVQRSDIIFICVKPLDIHPLLTNISTYLTKQKCIVSITSPITVEQLESVVKCQVARIIPSITNRALSGVSLITFGENCSTATKEYLETLFGQISKPVHIDNNITRVASDIVSCGPAFFSYLLQKFVHAAVKETEIPKELATVLTSEMIIGLGKLLEKECYTLPGLQEKVSVRGGVTGEGIRVLESEIGDLFEHVFQSTHRKYAEDIAEVGKQFSQIY
jgi:competence protein ComER